MFYVALVICSQSQSSALLFVRFKYVKLIYNLRFENICLQITEQRMIILQLCIFQTERS